MSTVLTNDRRLAHGRHQSSNKVVGVGLHFIQVGLRKDTSEKGRRLTGGTREALVMFNVEST